MLDAAIARIPSMPRSRERSAVGVPVTRSGPRGDRQAVVREPLREAARPLEPAEVLRTDAGQRQVVAGAVDVVDAHAELLQAAYAADQRQPLVDRLAELRVL